MNSPVGHSNIPIYFAGLISGIFLVVFIHLIPEIIQAKFWHGSSNRFLVGAGIVAVSSILNYFAGSIDRTVRRLSKNK